MEKILASFRDPNGFVYKENNVVYRTITPSYFQSYDLIMASGLYKQLTDTKKLIAHTEVTNTETERVIKPEFIPFISYPYEWSFSQLKDAALLTLDIQEEALAHGMSLKDASIYNVQYLNGKPIFIDTLSFEPYQEGKPWVAYKQFCQHFLAPLALMSHTDVKLNQLLKIYIDGIPVDLTSNLLPAKTYFKLSLLLHIHLHAKAQKKYEHTTSKSTSKKISLYQLRALIDSLRSAVNSCSWKPTGTEWVDYYQDDSYTITGFEDKNKIVRDFLALIQPETTWDLGANDGHYSRLAAMYSKHVLSFDIDPACVENNYLKSKINGITKTLPLLLDLTNPSPSIGWANKERESLEKRGTADCLLSLALVHHLAISNNLPLDYIASYFAQLCTWLIIEFVPKSDKKVQKLLTTREDVFTNYTQELFEKEFEKHFVIHEKVLVQDSERVLYLMKRK